MGATITRGDVGHYNFALPFMLVDISNGIVIMSKPIPSDIADNKNIVITETPIPGLDFSPINQSGQGNRKISFTLPIIKRNNTIGNTLQLKQFENLRQKAFGLASIFLRQGQFTPGPKVLFNWGIGSIPLIWYVSKCDFNHKAEFVNQLGNPQWTDVSLELILDEENPLNIGEGIFRKLSSMLGTALGFADAFQPDKRTY